MNVLDFGIILAAGFFFYAVFRSSGGPSGGHRSRIGQSALAFG